MRGMTVKETHSEIKSTLKIDISINSLYNRLQRYEEINAKELQELKKSNHTYISRMMDLLNHFGYYRKIIMAVLNDPKNKQSINSASLYKAIELLQKLDQTEFSMLEEIPELFSWKRFNNIGQRNPFYNSSMNDDQNEKSIEEYVTSIEQIPIPADLEELQSNTEDENLLK